MALIVDHEERVSMLKSLINEYNSVYSNIPAIMTPARHTFVLICIICRINGLLSPYVGSISSGSIDDWQEDNSFIFKTIHMTGIIKQQLGVETDDELFGLMKTKLSEIHMDRSSSNVASPVPIREKLIKTRSVENCARVVSMSPRSSSGKKLQMMNAKAKEFIPLGARSGDNRVVHALRPDTPVASLCRSSPCFAAPCSALTDILRVTQ